MPEPTPEELAEEEVQRKKRARYRRKYERKKERERQIKEGLIVPGEPYHLSCAFCGEPFDSRSLLAKFCGPNCRAAFYRQEARESRTREYICANCGTPFTAWRKDVKYCCDRCRAEGHSKRQKQRNAEKHESSDSAEANEKTA